MIPLLLALACTGADEPAAPATSAQEDTGPATTTPTGDTDPSRPDPCLARGPATLDLWRPGDRRRDAEPLAAGAVLELNHGPTGGWTADLAVQASNVPQLVQVDLTVRRTRDGLALNHGDALLRFALAPGAPDRPETQRDGEPWACEGWATPRVLFDPFLVPGDDGRFAPICGEPARIEVRLSDLHGEAIAESTHDVVLQPDRCDCEWCGPTADDAPACDETRGPWHDDDNPGVPRCDRP